MSPHAQPHGPVRTLLLVVSTVAVVGVVFAIYIQYAQTPDGAETELPPVHELPRPPIAAATTQPHDASAMQIEGVPLPQGGRTRINLYGPEGDEARLELEVDSWEPVGSTGREFNLEQPTIRFRTPAGQLVNVSADRGLVEMTKLRANKYDLARGRLEGHVAILMDRLDEEERAKLPPEQRDELTDARRIEAELEDLTFDLEYARVESSGRVHAWLEEAEFEGRQLLLRYDEAASRIEYLKILEGKRITLRGLGRSLAITLPGTAGSPTAEMDEEPDTSAKEDASAATVTASEPAAGEPIEDDGVPLFVPDVPAEPRVRETVTYTATFEGDIVVNQSQGQKQTGTLRADRLAFLFDFGQQQRDLARQLPASQAAPQTQPAAEATQPAVDGGESEVVLNWSGPLVVDLIREQGEVPEDVFGKRLQVTATGREVQVADQQGSARCRKLVYHYETEQVWLYGDAETACALEVATGGHLVGREVSFDPQGRTAHVLGPGELSDRRTDGVLPGLSWRSTGGGSEMSVRFQTEMNLRLGTVAVERADPVTGELQVRQRDYLQSAELLGDVVMAQDEDSIAADRVQIGFRPPLRQGELADSIESLHAEGRVRMAQGDERITCRSLDVKMARDAGGRVVPVRADAAGDVVAAQGQRSISATERMIVDLQSVPVEKPPFDLVQAKITAVRRGLDINEIDWDAQREKYEREKDFSLGLRRLQAFGNVAADDPEQNLLIDAGHLDCSFKNGRTIDRGVVSGRGDLPARLEFADFGIMGRDIEFDAQIQTAEVLGAGRMTFTSRKDLDGQTLEVPVPIAVTWTDFMTFRGQRNTAVFAGSVHAVSKDSTFDCHELVLDFQEEQPRTASVPKSPHLWDWWLVRPFRAGFRGAERLRLEAPQIRKQLAYLSANGNVTGLSARYDETGALKSRARIAGPHLAVDLRSKTQAMTIDDAGSLLIEDYRLRTPDGAGTLTKMSPFGASGENLPSQTFITWEGAMSFYSGNRLAVFENDVELVYRSGSKLLLPDGVLSDAALTRMRESAEGRDARLLCQQLNVQFVKSEDRRSSGPSGGVGGISGNEVSSFTSSGGVYFEDSGVSVTCRTITFDRERDLLQILGTRNQPAELIDQRGGRYRSIRGPTIYWERDTDRIEAPRSTIRVQ